jgi:hypothetical protein
VLKHVECSPRDDASINKRIKNISAAAATEAAASLEEAIGVAPALRLSVAKARAELSKLPECPTPLGKAK